VEKGALFLELDRERYVAAVESAEANLRAAQANADLVRENMLKVGKDLVRVEQLHQQSLESASSLDAAAASSAVEQARHKSTLDQVAQARAALKQARDDLAKTTIYAPMSGTVGRLSKEEGRSRSLQFQADVVLELSNLGGMEALVDVDENDVVLVALGDRATIEVDALPDAALAGSVPEIASSAKTTASGTADPKTEFEVKVAVDEVASALRPGMTASSEIVTDTRDNALAVPIQSVALRALDELGAKEGAALTPDKDGFVTVVWVVSDGVAHARQVKTGIQGAELIEVVDGLGEGEEVVVGSFKAISRDLRDGTAVRPEPPAQRG
jgi:HlyD family secretion protein